jgi:hypothetical protein
MNARSFIEQLTLSVGSEDWRGQSPDVHLFLMGDELGDLRKALRRGHDPSGHCVAVAARALMIAATSTAEAQPQTSGQSETVVDQAAKARAFVAGLRGDRRG